MKSTTKEGVIKKQNNSQRELKYSYNPNIIPDLDKEGAAKKVRGWELGRVEWDETKLKQLVQTECG